ncbi:ubiquinol-cytochrome-c reductase complex, Reiske ISP-associated subunit Qcr10 [Schizosaccharomyces osmophilus]|uniref:Ubiquinol-cytochrome-c reductase complex, Reiske ISP-associated subunit Qcr10 n=1 Tax=Schizosaccharomyces osmophilus TaxID=2545709 RepID=A0AAE9W8N2_9SCHI|nr:ubiquinol-cytochrome-c reductase complex, Reiske ISP-associated subunit Qcr10 [Schizosaccharomyces osmophilus]WBW71274.1 ubiquinol-cytochrome-c reductase complex, Reiske ISP-associated subunit Qcr10 [Schizosaccharomyces osmophilus]
MGEGNRNEREERFAIPLSLFSFQNWFAMVPFFFNKPLYRVQPHVSFITPERTAKTIPAISRWTLAAGAAVFLFAMQVPKVKSTILQPIAFLGDHFKDKTPEEDKWL